MMMDLTNLTRAPSERRLDGIPLGASPYKVTTRRGTCDALRNVNSARSYITYNNFFGSLEKAGVTFR